MYTLYKLQSGGIVQYSHFVKCEHRPIPALCSPPCVYTEKCSTAKSLVIFYNGAIPYLKKSWIAKSKTIHESCTGQSNTTPMAECWIVLTTWVMSFGFLIQDSLRYGIGIPNGTVIKGFEKKKWRKLTKMLLWSS